MTPTLRELEHDPDALRRRAEEVLQAPPYLEQQPGPVTRAVRQVLDTVAGWIESLLTDATVAGLLPWLLVLAGLAVLTVVVLRLTRGLAVDRSVAQVPVTAVGRAAAEWDGDAEAALERGELREAVRLAYAGVVRHLGEAGLLEDEPGRTVRELDAALAARSVDGAVEVAAAGDRFEQVIYGGRAASREDVEVVVRAREAVLAGRTRPRGGDRLEVSS